MSPQFDRFDGYSIFDDKGEVKRLVENLVQMKDSDVSIERLRKMDFSYIFTLSKKKVRQEKWSWFELKSKPAGSGEKGTLTKPLKRRLNIPSPSFDPPAPQRNLSIHLFGHLIFRLDRSC